MLCGLIWLQILRKIKKKKKALSGDKWSFLQLWFHALEDKELISLKTVIEGTVQSNTLTLDNFKQR